MTTRGIPGKIYDKGGAEFNVCHRDYAADRTGVADAAPAIAACFTDLLAAGGGTMRIPGGAFKIASPLVFSITGTVPKGIRILCDPEATTLVPTAAVSGVAIKLATDVNTDGMTSAMLVEGLRLDGLNTSGVIGIQVGDNAAHLSGRIRLRHCSVFRFTGVGAIGIDIKDVVDATFYDVYSGRNTDNWRVGGSDPALPTICKWFGGSAREATRNGINIVRGYKLVFSGGFTSESNAEAGVFCTPVAGENVTEVLLDDFWCENNWTIHAAAPSTRVTKANITADGTAAGTISISCRDSRFTGIARWIDYKRVVNLVVASPIGSVIRSSGTTISATATGYHRAAGSWISDGYIVGQQLRVRGFATAGNNGTKTITAVTALDISVAGTSVEAAGPSITIVVQTIFFDANCNGVIRDWPTNNVPLDVIANLSPVQVNGDMGYGQGRWTIDPDTGHIIPSNSGAFSLGTSVFRLLDIWLAGKLTSPNADITSVLTMTGAIVGNSGGNKDVIVQPGTSSGRVVMRDSAAGEKVRMLGTGDFQALVSLLIGGSGTAVTQTRVYTPTLTPASVAAQSVVEQTFTVTGLTTADKVVAVNPPATANNIGIAGVRVSAADTLAIRFANPTAGALTPTSGTYAVVTMRS